LNNKDKTIIEIVDYLQSKFGQTDILIQDYWESDYCAIGLTDRTGQYLVYISTYGTEQDRFNVSLENPPIDLELPYSQGGDIHNLSLEDLEKIVIEHLRLNPA
jgi:hypothetical protein